MWRSLVVLEIYLLGAALAATFLSKPVPEDPAHPGQCYDEVLRSWHQEHESWNRGGECLQSFCSVSVGYLDAEETMRNLEQLYPGVYTRFEGDPGKVPFSSGGKNRTMEFKARGKKAEFLYVEGEEPTHPQTFVSEQTITCFYHVNLPSNCRETDTNNSLPYPACCPKLVCTGEPLGPIEALG